MGTERRKFPRSNFILPMEVQGYACERGSFHERTETYNVSQLGASFRLYQQLAIDDIVLINLAMPRQLRLFDLESSQYKIYAQVRRTRLWPDGSMMVGVAFISKDPPELDSDLATINSLSDTPTSRNYSTTEQAVVKPPLPTSSSPPVPSTTPLTPMAESGGANQRLPLVNDRDEPRARLRLSLNIRGIDKKGQYFIETIQTEDVSKHGLCFFICQHELEVNSIVELVGFQGKFTAQGEVRHTSYIPDKKNYRIGLRLLGEPNHWVVK
ncbi:MAG: PilZ domain-containing protein [Acidobacteriota bacterium]